MSLFESASLVVTPNGTKASKLYAIKPTSGAGDLSVTRATTATRVNSSGLIESVSSNVPRLDYSNGSCPSILVEPQRTNLALYSQLYTTYWGNFTTITANYGISPDGTQNSTRFQMSSAGALQQTIAVTPLTTYTVSFYCKLKTGTTASLGVYNYTANNFIFQDNLFSSLVPNEWVLIKRTFTTPALCTSITGEFWRDSNIDCEIWGFQMEQGSYRTSYIPTTSASVTRNADVISKTGISSLIGQTEGTIYFEGKINALPVDGSLFGIQKNSSNFVIRFGSQGTNIYAQSYNGSANLFFEATPYTLGSRVKAAFAYKAGSYAFYINGVQIATGSNATAIPACDATMFNSLWGSFNDSVSFYSAAALWKTRLTNAELAEITTI